jgi:hypothetical protein
MRSRHKLDLCFKAEKAKLLKVINKDMHEKRKEEDEAYADAVGHQLSFEEYLNQDPNYLRGAREIRTTRSESLPEAFNSGDADMKDLFWGCFQLYDKPFGCKRRDEFFET